MQQTTNYNLNVIEQSDKILDSVTALGQNATSIDTILAGKIDKTSIATNITSSSTNNEVAGAKAVNDLINKPRAIYVLNSNKTINPQIAYTPVDIVMEQEYNNDTSTFSFNTSTGEITILKAGRYQLKVNTQLRGSSDTTSTVFVTKGFGYRVYRGGTSVDTFTVTEQCYVTEYANIYGEISTDLQQNDIIKPMGYSRVRAGTIGSLTTIVWGSKRTSIEIQLIEETTQTRSLNLMKSANEEETEEKELEEKEPIEELKQEETKAEGSGDAR